MRGSKMPKYRKEVWAFKILEVIDDTPPNQDSDGSPLHPEALELLMGDTLAPFLQRVSQCKPTKAFHEQSNYDPTEKAIMDALNGIGLSVRYKAVLKASGAPKQ